MATNTIKLSQYADLEIKDPNVIFKSVWDELERESGKENLRFPHEIIWLGGAPGAGKGTQTPFIQRERGFTAPPIVISSLLTSDKAQALKDAGLMVGDREVLKILLQELLNPEYQSGVIIDGFPRTEVQVGCLKLFYHKMIELRNEFLNTLYARFFRYPSFRIALLFVEERVSVERQLNRGRETIAENERRKQEGKELLEERKTDFDENLARNRYRVFKEQTYEALRSLKNVFHFHLINAEGPVSLVQENIAKEFTYQSSLDLDHATFELLHKVPLASEITIHTRQELVKRLENYSLHREETFKKVIEFIHEECIPLMRNQAISGRSVINTDTELLAETEHQAMLVDILSERGYRVTVDERSSYIPERVDPNTFEIKCKEKKSFRISIKFPGSGIRRGGY